VGSFEAPGTDCPPLRSYSAEQQASLLAELQGLPEGSAIVEALKDYKVLRDQVKACRAGGGSA